MDEVEVGIRLANQNERLLRLEFHDAKHIFKHDGVYYKIRVKRRSPDFMLPDEYEKEFKAWRMEHEDV